MMRAAASGLWLSALLSGGCGLYLQAQHIDEPYRLYLKDDVGTVSQDLVSALNEVLSFERQVEPEPPAALIQLLSHSVSSTRLATGGGVRLAEQAVSLTLRYRLSLVDADGERTGAGIHQCRQRDYHPVDETRSLATGARRRAVLRYLAQNCVSVMRYEAQRQSGKIDQPPSPQQEQSP